MSKKPPAAPVPENTSDAFMKIIRKATTKESQYRMAVCLVTAEIASQFLALFNVGNRPKTPSLIKEYAMKFLRGVWEENGEPLLFGQRDADGTEIVEAISLQHRMMALVEANRIYSMDENAAEKYPDAQLSFVWPVIYGIPLVNADSVDTGKGRKHVDVLFRSPMVSELIDEENGKTAASRKRWATVMAVAARLCWLREGGATVSSAPKFDVEEMIVWIDNNKHLAQVVNVVMEIDRNDGGNKGLRMSLGYIAALVYIACMDADGAWSTDTESALLQSLRQVASGTDLAKGSPEWAMAAYWNALTQQPGSKHRDYQWVGPFCKFINAVLGGESGLKPTAYKLTAKEEKDYANFPPLLEGWDTACFERAKATEAETAVKARKTHEPQEAEEAE